MLSERAGRPSTSTTDDNIDKVKKILLANRRITVREVAEDRNISIGSCYSIIMVNTEENIDSNPITYPYYYAQDVNKFVINYYNQEERLHDLTPNRIAVNDERQSKSEKCSRKRNRSQDSSLSSYII
ncbi:unnamed protein product [Parnassius mnemosyne]|uniref:Uncharacterized protein n=1 Tax=Parnassius mnemosyne TaxID=213953 RepID=A0AAV1M2K1_9NEOP